MVALVISILALIVSAGAYFKSHKSRLAAEEAKFLSSAKSEVTHLKAIISKLEPFLGKDFHKS